MPQRWNEVGSSIRAIRSLATKRSGRRRYAIANSTKPNRAPKANASSPKANSSGKVDAPCLSDFPMKVRMPIAAAPAALLQRRRRRRNSRRSGRSERRLPRSTNSFLRARSSSAAITSRSPISASLAASNSLKSSLLPSSRMGEDLHGRSRQGAGRRLCGASEGRRGLRRLRQGAEEVGCGRRAAALSAIE